MVSVVRTAAYTRRFRGRATLRDRVRDGACFARTVASLGAVAWRPYRIEEGVASAEEATPDLVVGVGRVELPRPSGHTDLNRARLPFRHTP